MPEIQTAKSSAVPTFDSVWAMMQENAEAMKELRESQKETDRLIRETRESQKETDRQLDKTGRKLDQIGQQIGGLHRSFGELAEHLVAPGIAERFNEFGYHFDIIATKGMKIHDEKGKEIAEIDIFLENSNYLMAVEVKATVKIKDIEHHIGRLEILKKHRVKNQEKQKEIMGAIAGAVFGSAEKKAAIEAGFYVLEQSGDTMKMSIPEDFVPRKW